MARDMTASTRWSNPWSRGAGWAARRRASLVIAWLAAVGAPLAVAAPPQPLPAVGADAQYTVSGLSSGAYMAAQYAVAFSSEVQGVGVVAGGPWDCAQGSVVLATTGCSCLPNLACHPTTPSVLAFESAMRAGGKASVGLLDPLEHLRRQRVWLYWGDGDTTVPPSNVQAVAQFYGKMKVPAAQIKTTHKAAAGHGLPVVDTPVAVACNLSEMPFLTNCGIDAAGDLLAWLYPGRTAVGAPAAGALRDFDQRPYLQGLEYTGLADTGYVYIPAACQAAGAGCAVHVVFHGCRQSRDYRDGDGPALGAEFVENAGYNRWAEGSRLVLLYPQVKPVDTGNPLVQYQYNPKGCWDFWGYTRVFPSIDLQTTKSAPQMQAVRAMVQALQTSP